MERCETGVAIVGGGPAGTTAACLLKKYNPALDVAIFEREAFPRDHIGESQLPAITWILEEMGVWDKVEAEGFPIKLGGTYRWGATDELWHLDFIPPESYVPVPRPAPLTDQRRLTAFQVDRSKFDQVLLDHAESMGCRVFRETRVVDVDSRDDAVLGLAAQTSNGELFRVEAEYYVDASGEAGTIRKAMEVPVEYPTSLRNIAFWDYWQQADWAERIGLAATRIQVMSLGWGWMWFIPISESRTSIGLVLPVEKYKSLGKKPDEIYQEAVAAEPLIRELTKNAQREHRFTTTKDWNFLSDRLAGENWFLAGDCGGFADPILSAGMTLAHTSGRKVAFSILELLRGTQDPMWIRLQYSDGHRHQIRHHMRFAEFWYAGNGRFTDLKEYCSELARSSGLKLDAEEAFAWLGTGGFARDTIGVPMAATFPMQGVKLITSKMTGHAAANSLRGRNMVRNELQGVERTTFASYELGGVRAVPCLVRGESQLPLQGAFALLLQGMGGPVEIDVLIRACIGVARSQGAPPSRLQPRLFAEALEALVAEGWATAFQDPAFPDSKLTVHEAAGLR